MRSVVIGGLVLAAGAAFAQLSPGVTLEPIASASAAAQDEAPTVAEPPPPPGIDDAGAEDAPVTLEEAVPEAGEKVLPAAREGADAEDDGLQPRRDATASLPEKVRAPDDDGTAVTIRTEGDNTIEEYRRAGQIYMIRVQPAQGIAYTYLDTDGDGRLERNPDEEIEGPVKPVYYTLYEWE